MSSRSERRTERATAEEVAEVERQLWEFAKRIDPPSVPEAKSRPGAFLYRVHRTWHSLGRGTGGLASRSFRALRDELLKPRSARAQSPAESSTAIRPFHRPKPSNLIDVMLESWHIQRSAEWKVASLEPSDASMMRLRGLQGNQDRGSNTREPSSHSVQGLTIICSLKNQLAYRRKIFLEERGRNRRRPSFIPTKRRNHRLICRRQMLYGGFSSGLVGGFFDAAATRRGGSRRTTDTPSYLAASSCAQFVIIR